VTDRIRLLIEKVNLRTILLTTVLGAVGLALVYASQPIDSHGYHKTGSVIRELGVLLFATVAIAVLWDVVGKRAFADEILAKANMSRDLADAGIDVVTTSFQDKRIVWEDLFKNACKLDIFVSYAHTWRNTNLERIDSMLSDSDAKVRVVLPDPDDKEIVRALATRYESKPEDVEREITTAKAFFEHRKSKAKGRVEIYFVRMLPLFSFYRFNNKVVFALYNHRTGRLPVPTFVADEDGFLFKYFTEEIEGIIADPKRTRRAPEAAGQVG